MQYYQNKMYELIVYSIITGLLCALQIYLLIYFIAFFSPILQTRIYTENVCINPDVMNMMCIINSH